MIFVRWSERFLTIPSLEFCIATSRLLANSKALDAATKMMAEPFLDAKIDIVAAAEARGLSLRDRWRFN